mmetsp:Transcript_23700/g.65790  ORF Transcript_23700/g.65790 Transcript_23700/m.65790 type:complete len:81 (-) Transcript_23700:876-1118(-)
MRPVNLIQPTARDFSESEWSATLVLSCYSAGTLALVMGPNVFRPPVLPSRQDLWSAGTKSIFRRKCTSMANYQFIVCAWW